MPTDDWWLLEQVLPDLEWARVRSFVDGSADVLDSDNETHSFSSAQDARIWLSEEEFVPVSALSSQELAAFTLTSADVVPPSATSDADLVRLMSRRWSFAELLRDLAAATWFAPWALVDSSLHRLRLEGELERELASLHPLYQRPARAIAHRQDRDDVLFAFGDPPELGVVHLTYTSQSPETPPYPLASSFLAAWAFIDQMLRDHTEWNAG